MSSNTYGRGVWLPLTNKSGGGVIAGDVVVVDTANNDAFTTNSAGSFTGSVGVAQGTIAAAAVGLIAFSGYVPLVNVNGSNVTRGHFARTALAKTAAGAGASRTTGTFAQFLTGGTTPDALLYPVDYLQPSMTNPMTTTGDIIYSSDGSGTPARLAGGTAGKFLTAAGAAAPAWGQGPLTTTGDLMIGATGGTPTRLAIGAAGTHPFSDGSALSYKGAIGAGISETTAQALTHGTAAVLTSNDAELWDTNAFHDTGSNTSRLTVPTGFDGKYLIVAAVSYAGNITGIRDTTIRKNGTDYSARMTVNAAYNAAYPNDMTVTLVDTAVATNYYEILAYQDSGGNLNCTMTRFSIVYLGA